MRRAEYERVSSDEQRDKGSIQTQTEELRRHAAYTDDEVVARYSDDGVSGTVPVELRPAGRRLLADALAGAFDVVVVYRFDRIARTQLELWRFVDALDKAGVKFASVKEQIDTSTAAGRMFLGVLGSMAEFERASIRQRSMDGTARILDEGKWPGGPRPRYGLRVVDGRLALDPVESPHMRAIVDLYLSGMRLEKVCADLNGRGVPSPGGVLWNTGSLARILKDPFLYGDWHYPKEATVKDPDGRRRRVKATAPQKIVKIEPIVDRRTFHRIQQALAARKLHGTRNAKNEYLLSGLIRCGNERDGGVCGGRYVGTPAGHQGRLYYVCQGRGICDKVHRCRRAYLPLEAVEGEVWDAVRGWLGDPRDVMPMIAARLGQADGDLAALEERRAGLDAALAASAEERREVIAMRRKKQITEEDLEAQLADVLREQERVQADLRRVSVALAAATGNAAQLRSVERSLAALRARAERGTFADRRDVVRALVVEVVVARVPAAVHPSGWSIEVRWRFPLWDEESDCVAYGTPTATQSTVLTFSTRLTA